MIFLKKKITRRLKFFSAGLVCGILAGALLSLPLSRLGPDNEEVKKTSASVTESGADADVSGDGEMFSVSDGLAAEGALPSERDGDNARMLSEGETWYLTLVNRDHPLSSSYVPSNLTPVDSVRSVDSRIAGELQQMMADGKAQGLHMYVTSGYRSYDYQTELFNKDMQKYISGGSSPLDAYNETSKSVAVPGTSEHATGLAVDIIAEGYTELDERQADTPEYEWLSSHCQEYGFILRYPSGKEDITGIIYEPWHYRYVGTEAAAVIMERGITLEEYVEELSLGN